MCRIAAYIGQPITLSRLLYDAPHGLEHQSYAPREMISGTVNVDGTGVVWWLDEDTPLRYTTPLPPWSDPNLPGLAPRLSGSPILATVRSATPGIPSGSGSVLPFLHDAVAGTHNGYLRRFSEATAAACVSALPSDLVGAIETLTDSAVLFLLAIAQLRESASGDLGAAAVAAVDQVVRICRDAKADCSLNLVLANADGIAAVRCARGVEANSLYTATASGGFFLASEPLDERHDWSAVRADHVVRMDRSGIEIEPASIVP